MFLYFNLMTWFLEFKNSTNSEFFYINKKKKILFFISFKKKKFFPRLLKHPYK